MFEIGSQVLYGVHGVCRICAVETRRFGKEMAEYYVLQPLAQADAKFYVPTRNQAAVSKMRPVLTREQVEQMLSSPRLQQNVWVADESQRKQVYKQLLGGNDREKLLQMMHAAYLHKQSQAAQGRKFHQCDELFLHDAERVLHGELSMALGIPQGEVIPYLRAKLG